MNIKKMARFLLLPAVLIPALALAQGQGGGRGPGGPGGIDRLATDLTLTAGQKTDIQTILTNQRTATEPLMTQMQTLQASILTAVKSNSKAQIDSLAAQLGALQGQLAAARYESEASIYNLLTAEQKAKADTAYPNGLPLGGGMGGGGAMGQRRPPAQN